MKLSSKVAHGLARLSEYFVALGPIGLFAVALLDSAFVPLPSSADALLILLTIAHPRLMIVYALIATAGSGIGCVTLYYISRRAGSRALKRFSPARQARVKQLIDRYDVLSVLVASLMPPPFPFKIFVVSAGVFRFSIMRFTIAILAGRMFRFSLLGYLTIRYGARARQILASPWIAVGLVLVIVVFLMIRMAVKRRAKRARVENLEAAQGQENPLSTGL